MSSLYNNGTLASTGLAGASLAVHSMWIFLAGFALLAATMAVGRVLPRPAPRLQPVARVAIRSRRRRK